MTTAAWHTLGLALWMARGGFHKQHQSTAASCAFMMPVQHLAMPWFSAGQLKINDLAKVGLWLNIAAIDLITLLMLTIVPLVFDL